ncbi:cytochrome c maturation protein CcmE [Oryzibacter oryziterrae]|uniref:cytochrome c maturation protein CcmE n=1 Tax=Oryzibacter oryziterrae TaxID=2766474 RepID=UPI001EFF899B|nr:cytochrome c maturation protein CcmE [Oryzibacter oryziterrae]
MTRKQRRLVLIGVVGVVLAAAVGLVLFAMSSQITLFRTPTELVQQTIDPSQRIRVGGLVEVGSVVKGQDAAVTFEVTDTANRVPVTYKGILPDLFREGQGVVAEGVLQNGVFMADTVLAKHDERYMPKEVVESLKKQGVWREGEPGGPAPGAAKP